MQELAETVQRVGDGPMDRAENRLPDLQRLAIAGLRLIIFRFRLQDRSELHDGGSRSGAFRADEPFLD